MLSKLREVLIRECRLDLNKPILVGLSGGPDSLVLLDVLHQLGYQVVIAHVNHKLRPESTAEASQVEKIAAFMGFPFVLSEIDV
jgi:tRNA(Ile)-lysidine synthase